MKWWNRTQKRRRRREDKSEPSHVSKSQKDSSFPASVSSSSQITWDPSTCEHVITEALALQCVGLGVGWEDDSAVKSIYLSCRERGFNSQRPQSSSQLSICQVPQDLTHSFSLHSGTHTFMPAKHSYAQNLKIKIYKTKNHRKLYIPQTVEHLLFTLKLI